MENTHPLPDPPSIWQVTGTVPDGRDSSPWDVEIVIAGAGLAGVAAALLLARAGRRIVVVDAATVGSRTTGRSTAKLSLLQGTTYQKVHRYGGEQVLRNYAQAQRAAHQWLTAELTDADVALVPRTAYTYATTAHGDHALREEAAAMASVHVHASWLPAGDIGLPFPVTSALHMPDQAQLHPIRALAQLTREAQALGVRFVDACRINRVGRVGNRVRVHTSAGEIVADRLLVMTGFPVIDRAGFFAALLPSRQLVGAYRVPDGVAVPQGMFLSADAETRSLRSALDTDGRELLIVGGDSFFPGRADTDAVRRRLDAWVTAHFSGAVPVRWWAAQDYTRVDHRPFMGVVPATGGRVLAASGFAKWGMTNAVAGALALAGEVLGEPPAWAHSFRSRGITPRGGAHAASAGAGVAGRLVSGWIRPEQKATDAQAARARMVRSSIRPVAETVLSGTHCRVSGVCTHLGGVLKWNSAELSWDCPLHGSRFAPDGRALEGPATRDLRPL